MGGEAAQTKRLLNKRPKVNVRLSSSHVDPQHGTHTHTHNYTLADINAAPPLCWPTAFRGFFRCLSQLPLAFSCQCLCLLFAATALITLGKCAWKVTARTCPVIFRLLFRAARLIYACAASWRGQPSPLAMILSCHYVAINHAFNNALISPKS